MWKTLETQAGKFIEGTKSPLEKHNDQLAEMTQLLDTGAMTWDQYALSIAGSNAEFAKQQQAPAVNAMSFDGAAMQRLQYEQQVQQRDTKPPIDKDATALKTYEGIRSSAGYLKTIAEKMSVLQPATIMEIP